MHSPRPRTPAHGFRTFFVRGLVILLPSVLTLWLLVKAYQFVDNSIAAPINGWVRAGIVQLDRMHGVLPEEFTPTPEAVAAELSATRLVRRPLTAEVVEQRLREELFRKWWEGTWYMNLVGLLIAVIAVYTAGRLLGGFFGRRLYRRVEGVFFGIPVVRSIYPHIKQVVDFLLSDERSISFNRVVAVQYPREGIWSIALVTGEGMQPLQGTVKDPLTLFIPSSPTPFTGYTITVPREQTIEMPLTIDEALRFVVTAGVLLPGRREFGDTASVALAVPAGTAAAAADEPPRRVEPRSEQHQSEQHPSEQRGREQQA